MSSFDTKAVHVRNVEMNAANIPLLPGVWLLQGVYHLYVGPIRAVPIAMPLV